MKPTDLADCTATDLLALYRSRQASPVEATNAVLARIERAKQSRPHAPARRAGSAVNRAARSTACRRRSKT